DEEGHQHAADGQFTGPGGGGGGESKGGKKDKRRRELLGKYQQRHFTHAMSKVTGRAFTAASSPEWSGRLDKAQELTANASVPLAKKLEAWQQLQQQAQAEAEGSSDVW